MFPKVEKSRDGSVVKVRVRYLTHSVGLDIDEEKCQGCGICVKVCPTGAMDRGPVGAAKKNVLEDLIPTLVKPETCSYCGLCTYMCPWNAITLIKDDKPVPLEELDIIVNKAAPKLEYEMKECKEGVPPAKFYLEGELEINTANCAGGCNTCIDVCPTGALSVQKPSKPWDKGRKILVDKNKCILCGTCTNACPVDDAIHLKITGIKYSGEYNDIFWNKVIESLKISRLRDRE